ncbi:MAG: outer membrane beta-barrel domain-containing protein [Bdellovibrionales bacterium]
MKRIYLVLIASTVVATGWAMASVNSDPTAPAGSKIHESSKVEETKAAVKSVSRSADPAQGSAFVAAPVKPQLTVEEIRERGRVEAKARAEAQAREEAQARADMQAQIEAQKRAEASSAHRSSDPAQVSAFVTAPVKPKLTVEEIRERGRVEAKARAEAQAREEAQARAETKAQIEAQKRAEAQALIEEKARVKAEAKALAEEQVRNAAQMKADAKQARIDAQARAQAETKARIEAEAKALAEERSLVNARAHAAVNAQDRNQARTEAEVRKELSQQSAEAAPSAASKEAVKAPAHGTLEEQLKSLDAGNAAPIAANREKLYAVQQRYLPLRWKSEVSFGAASNLTGDSFLRTQQLEAGYHLHLSDRWSLGFAYAWVDNKLKSDANGLKTSNGAIPDLPYAKTRMDLMAEYNVFYGKFRWSADTVSYFDQYLALGAGNVEQNTGTTTSYVADVGFAFWLGKFASTRLGLKDYYYKEAYRSGPEMTNNLHAHLDLGVLF